MGYNYEKGSDELIDLMDFVSISMGGRNEFVGKEQKSANKNVLNSQSFLTEFIIFPIYLFIYNKINNNITLLKTLSIIFLL